MKKIKGENTFLRKDNTDLVSAVYKWKDKDKRDLKKCHILWEEHFSYEDENGEQPKQSSRFIHHP